MAESEVWDEGPEGEEIIWVATDGGCSKTATGPRAGWGYASDNPAIGHRHGPTKGRAQTAPRGEVLGVTHALVNGGGKLHILTDSKYVAITLNKVKQGKQPKGRRQDLWTKIWEHRNRLDGVTWVKVHLAKEEA